MALWPKFIDINKYKNPISVLHVIEDRCKGCGFCIEFCPKRILEVSPKFNKKGYHPPKLKEGVPEDACVGCRFCEFVCPEFAIYHEFYEQSPADEKEE